MRLTNGVPDSLNNFSVVGLGPLVNRRVRMP
jgi:hypothetical protein